MPSGLYLGVMLGIIAVAALIVVPNLFWKKCTECGIRNGLDALECKECHQVFPED